MKLAALLLAAGAPLFVDRTPDSGIRFRLDNSPTSQMFLIETMTGGVGLIDYDGDGKFDLYFVNGAAIGSNSIDKSDPRYWNRLYRNLGNWKFEDVTAAAGVQGKQYGMGVAVADYDNDGRPDLFVTNYGANELFHNEGGGKFREVGEQAGVKGGGFSTSAAFFDYDRDGNLDLYVARYLDWSFATNPDCRSANVRDYCHPNNFRGISGLLYRNNGDGTFTDVSVRTGIGAHAGKGLGVAVADFNRDGWPDFYVANDSVPGFLFMNRNGQRFEETGLVSATAVNADGKTFAGMGVDAGDYDNDGWPDILVTALSLEGFALFRNNHDGTFDDIAERTGLKRASFPLGGWGAKLIDYDNDGQRDIFVANSHVMRYIQKSIRTLSYQQPLLLLRGGSMVPTEVLPGSFAARGAAFGDIDNDGDTDIVVQVLGGEPLLLENTSGNRNSWLGVDLAGAGAQVEITADDRKQTFTATAAGSYLSSSDPRVLAGLSSAQSAEIRATWPSGRGQTLSNVRVRQYLKLKEPSH